MHAQLKRGEDARLQVGGQGVAEEHTLNMWFMSVMREVFQPSDLLKASAYCRRAQAGHTRCEGESREAGGRGQQGPTADGGVQERGTAPGT